MLRSGTDASEARRCFARVCAGGANFALDAAALREVVRYREPRPLPGAPAAICGVLELRGALIPIASLAALVGRPEAGGRPTRIAVVEIAAHRLGLAVDAVDAVIAIDASAIADLPALARRGGGELVAEWIRQPASEPLPVLALDALLARIGDGNPEACAA